MTDKINSIEIDNDVFESFKTNVKSYINLDDNIKK